MDRGKLHSMTDLFKTGGEISYNGDAGVAKFLLGGIGTGNISVGARGELRDWEIFNWPGKGQFVPFSFLQSVPGRRERNRSAGFWSRSYVRRTINLTDF